MEPTLTSFNGTSIYLDTMLPYALLRSIDPNVKQFFEQIKAGKWIAYTAVLTFDELAYRLLLALIKDRYGSSPLDLLRADEAKYLAEFAPQIVTELERLRQLPNFVVLDVLTSDLTIIGEAMVQFHLRPRDALHYAAMLRVGCLEIASNDPHFDRIPTIKRYAL